MLENLIHVINEGRGTYGPPDIVGLQLQLPPAHRSSVEKSCELWTFIIWRTTCSPSLYQAMHQNWNLRYVDSYKSPIEFNKVSLRWSYMGLWYKYTPPRAQLSVLVFSGRCDNFITIFTESSNLEGWASFWPSLTRLKGGLATSSPATLQS